MKYKTSPLRALLAAVACACPMWAAAQSDGAVPREVIVMLATGERIEDVAATHGLSVIDRFGLRPIWRARVGAGSSVGDSLAALQGDARVRFAERNARGQSPESRRNVVWAIGGDAGTWAAQWAPAQMKLSQAHRLATGAGVRVAVLDTGIDLAHPLFAGRLAARPNGTLLGIDYVGNDNDPSEEGTPADAGFGHGTHVAGLVALAAPQAALMPVRVLDPRGAGNTWVLAEALLWAVDPDGNPSTDDGAHVINMSLGTTRRTQLLDLAMSLATCGDDDDDGSSVDTSDPGFDNDRLRCNLRPGTVVMAAAGNDASNRIRNFPAAERVEGGMAVAASTAARTLAGFSNHGRWVDIAAPGEQITSALPGSLWGVWSGTSMSAPLASGVAALLRQRNPDWKPVDVTKRLQDRSARLCGTALRQIDAHAAVADFDPVDPACP